MTTPTMSANAGTAGTRARSSALRSALSLAQRHAAALVLVLTVLIGGRIVPTFGGADNLRNVALNASFLALIAAGSTFVIISGGIDLSVGSVFALSGVVGAMTSGHGALAAFAAALATAAVIGVAQGLLIARAGLPPFIVTLAGLLFVRGLAFFITDEGNNVPRVAADSGLSRVGTEFLATLGIPIWIAVAVFAAGWVVLNRTAYGQSVFVIGESDRAAELMGVPVARTKVLIYAVSALSAGAAGFLSTAQSGSGIAAVGDGLELQAIAAVVIGGTLLTGGAGSIVGTAAGVLLLGVIQNLITQGGHFSSYVQQVVSGAFLLLVVVLQSLLTRRRRR